MYTFKEKYDKKTILMKISLLLRMYECEQYK